MLSLNRLAFISMTCTLAASASAQSADVSSTPGTLVAGTSYFAAPTDAPFLFTNGPYITGTGNGVGGADTSSLEVGANTFGYGCQSAGTTNNRVADDFVVPAGQNWTLSKLHWLGYQTNAPISGSITSISVNIWNTTPTTGGTPLWSSAANVLLTKTWTNVYRVNAIPGDAARAIFDVQGDLTGSPVLGPGTYWVDIQLKGSASFSGPWAPPTVPRLATDNGRQSITGTWAPTADTGGTGLPQDFPFALEGDDGVGGCGAVTAYCTAKVNSLGCTPAVASSGAAPSVAGCASPFNLTATNLLGNKNGLWFYGTNGLAGTAFQGGHLCIKPAIKRLAVTNSGGAGTACNGSLATDFNARICSGSDAALVAGALVGTQCWSRDPNSPSTTNLTSALSFTICP